MEIKIYNPHINSLKGFRAKANRTQKEIADIIGKDPATISRWEKDSTQIGAEDLQRLAKIFKIPMDLIFIGDESALSEFEKHAIYES